MKIKAYFNREDLEAVLAARDFCRSHHMRGHPALDTIPARMQDFVEATERLDRASRGVARRRRSRAGEARMSDYRGTVYILMGPCLSCAPHPCRGHGSSDECRLRRCNSDEERWVFDPRPLTLGEFCDLTTPTGFSP